LDTLQDFAGGGITIVTLCKAITVGVGMYNFMFIWRGVIANMNVARLLKAGFAHKVDPTGN
jgi:hypothetical protein